MTDTTSPIIDIQGAIFWDEVFNPQTQQPELRPVRTEIRFQRMGYDEWEVLKYQNMVHDNLKQFPHPSNKTEETTENQAS